MKSKTAKFRCSPLIAWWCPSASFRVGGLNECYAVLTFQEFVAISGHEYTEVYNNCAGINYLLPSRALAIKGGQFLAGWDIDGVVTGPWPPSLDALVEDPEMLELLMNLVFQVRFPPCHILTFLKACESNCPTCESNCLVSRNTFQGIVSKQSL